MTALELPFWEGPEVDQDFGRTFTHYSESAEMGSPEAFLNLGVSYMNGHGVEENKEKAFQYFCKAAELGNADGMYNAALLMRKRIVPNDETKSLEGI